MRSEGGNFPEPKHRHDSDSEQVVKSEKSYDHIEAAFDRLKKKKETQDRDRENAA